MLAALALLLVVGGIAYTIDRVGGADGLRNAADGPSDSPPATSSQTTSPSQRTEPASASASPATGRAAKAAFIREYFAAAPGGSDEAWARLGPNRREQGRASYDRFWRTIESVDVADIEPVPGTDSVDLTVTYHLTSGGVSTERQRLDLVRSGDGGFLIDNDRVLD